MPEQRIFFSRHDSQARIPLNRRGVIATLCPFSETVLELDEQLNPSRSQFVHVPSRLSHRTYKHRVSKMRERKALNPGEMKSNLATPALKTCLLAMFLPRTEATNI